MFTTTSEYSILECPPIMPYVIEKPTNRKFNTIEVAPNCPRCASSNTKFCYYNNYSFSQPRYFCKGCRRYWTKGGSLRNVPIGGGSRKRRRVRSKQSGDSNNEAPDHNPEHVGSTNTLNIDLADVFAKYVNQNVDNEKSSNPGASGGESSENVQERSFDLDSQMEGVVSMMMDYQNSMSLISGGDPVLPQLHENLNGHDDFTMYQNSNEFELQDIIGNSTSEDMLWSEDSTNFGAQQSIVQMPDLGLISSEHDQLRISANMILNDNWASFDISGFEIF